MTAAVQTRMFHNLGWLLRGFIIGCIEKFEPDTPQIWQWAPR